MFPFAPGACIVNYVVITVIITERSAKIGAFFCFTRPRSGTAAGGDAADMEGLIVRLKITETDFLSHECSISDTQPAEQQIPNKEKQWKVERWTYLARLVMLFSCC